MNPAISHLINESRALFSRLNQVKPFSLTMPMVPAASISPKALSQIDKFLYKGKHELYHLITDYLSWLSKNMSNILILSDAQRKFSILKLRFNDILAQVDIFADVLNQRSEQNTGIRISALDSAAADALRLPGNYYEIPSVICYLERGHGAAIRRARTRLPGGKENPVAVIQIPRERMIGSGIASSLFHEVGHQGAALLDLVKSLRMELSTKKSNSSIGFNPWIFWNRWISEIIADFWSISQLGIGATLGLIGVVSLPRIFVFRISLNDPHPFPWIRVKISCALGNALYPHPQWRKLSELWESLYPLKDLSVSKKRFIFELSAGIPEFVSIIMNHRPKSLYGDALGNIFKIRKRTPELLQATLNEWKIFPNRIFTETPSRAFAVIGQGKSDRKITPEKESYLLSELLSNWALSSSINNSMLEKFYSSTLVNKC